MQHFRVLVAVIVGTSLALSACGSARKQADPVSRQVEALRTPPDLTLEGTSSSMAIPDRRSDGASLSEYRTAEKQGRELLPVTSAGARLHLSEGRSWLEVKAAPEKVWDALQLFFDREGIELNREVSRIGLLQTRWMLYPAAGPQRPFAPGVEKESAARVRDSYRIRLERSDRGSETEVRVAHQRMTRSSARKDWERAPSDPFLEAEVLRTLMAVLAPERAQDEVMPEPRKRLVKAEGQPPLLVVNEPFLQSWRLVGQALDRAGFTLEDQDRSAGEYYIRYDTAAEQGEQKKGFFRSLAFWRDDDQDTLRPYVVNVREQGRMTEVSVTTGGGEPARAEVAERILGLVAEQLQ